MLIVGKLYTIKPNSWRRPGFLKENTSDGQIYLEYLTITEITFAEEQLNLLFLGTQNYHFAPEHDRGYCYYKFLRGDKIVLLHETELEFICLNKSHDYIAKVAEYIEHENYQH